MEPAEEPDPEVAPISEAMLFCPLCSSRLIELKCKLCCAKCGYYMSCADYI